MFQYYLLNNITNNQYLWIFNVHGPRFFRSKMSKMSKIFVCLIRSELFWIIRISRKISTFKGIYVENNRGKENGTENLVGVSESHLTSFFLIIAWRHYPHSTLRDESFLARDPLHTGFCLAWYIEIYSYIFYICALSICKCIGGIISFLFGNDLWCEELKSLSSYCKWLASSRT